MECKAKDRAKRRQLPAVSDIYAEQSSISIIVPVYNVRRQLTRCFGSIVSQSSDKFEVVIVDDGSTDGSEALCDLFQQTIPNRCKVIHQANGGLSQARNTGIEHASGKYILFLDSDDYLHPRAIEYLLDLEAKTSPDIIEFNYRRVEDSELMGWEDPWSFPVVQWDQSEVLRRLLGSNGCTPMTWSRLYNSALFDTVRFPVGKVHEDEFVTPIVCDRATSYVRSDAVLYAYVQRSGSIINRPFSRSRLDALEAFQLRYEYFHSRYGSAYDALIASSWLFCCKEIIRQGFKALTDTDRLALLEISRQMSRRYRAGDKTSLRFDKRIRTVLFSIYIKLRLRSVMSVND